MGRFEIVDSATNEVVQTVLGTVIDAQGVLDAETRRTHRALHLRAVVVDLTEPMRIVS